MKPEDEDDFFRSLVRKPDGTMIRAGEASAALIAKAEEEDRRKTRVTGTTVRGSVSIGPAVGSGVAASPYDLSTMTTVSTAKPVTLSPLPRITDEWARLCAFLLEQLGGSIVLTDQELQEIASPQNNRIIEMFDRGPGLGVVYRLQEESNG